jgi:hypothetical protein
MRKIFSVSIFLLCVIGVFAQKVKTTSTGTKYNIAKDLPGTNAKVGDIVDFKFQAYDPTGNPTSNLEAYGPDEVTTGSIFAMVSFGDSIVEYMCTDDDEKNMKNCYHLTYVITKIITVQEIAIIKKEREIQYQNDLKELLSKYKKEQIKNYSDGAVLIKTKDSSGLHPKLGQIAIVDMGDGEGTSIEIKAGASWLMDFKIGEEGVYIPAQINIGSSNLEIYKKPYQFPQFVVKLLAVKDKKAKSNSVESPVIMGNQE